MLRCILFFLNRHLEDRALLNSIITEQIYFAALNNAAQFPQDRITSGRYHTAHKTRSGEAWDSSLIQRADQKICTGIGSTDGFLQNEQSASIEEDQVRI